ncbi:MAG: VWA domain-containing protein [Myxococcota bacterium]
MSIDKSDPKLTAYAFDELSEFEKLEFEAKLGQSKSAQYELSEIQRTLNELRSEFSQDAPRQLDARRRGQVEAAMRMKAREGRQSRRRRAFGRVSLVGIAASVLLLTMVQYEPPREEVALQAPSDSPSAESDVEGTMTPVAPPYAAPQPGDRIIPRTSAPPMRTPRRSPPKQLRSDLEFDGPRAPAASPEPRAAVAQADEPLRSRSVDEPFGTRTPRALAAPNNALALPAPAASVKAGEWDDNANYREFTRWLATEPARAAHFLDLRERRFIVVRDAAGLGVPACRVVIEDEAERRTELITAASGRAILFPRAEGLSGSTLTASTNCGGGAKARFRITQQDGVIELRLATRRVLGERSIDVAFILDSTGSMSEEIAAVQATIQKVAAALRDSNVSVRVGLVEFKDRGDPYVTKIFPMSSDLALFSQQVAAVSAGGGGDTPESVNEALHVGVEQLVWNSDAFAKLAFLIGDAPPHLDYSQDYDYILEAREAAHRGIQVFTVAASGMDALGQVVWRQIAAYTGATNLFVLRGGAGPQSTGAGDPKSSCGGTQTAYTTGNLDSLILAKVRSAIRALDRDPMRIAGLYADENSKPCEKRIVME